MKLFILPVKILMPRGMTRHIQCNTADLGLKRNILTPKSSGLFPFKLWELHVQEMEDLGMRLIKQGPSICNSRTFQL